MSDWFLILLLPLAAWSGWWVAMRKEARDLRADKSRAAYFEGVGFLLNDQTDRAVEAFLHMADVDQQTLDNQLTLGSLFRKRGELDRALHLHQQLYQNSRLSEEQAQAVLYELAEDYNAAGMYTQAQVHFEQLLVNNPSSESVLAALIRICERTGQFQKAIDYAKTSQKQGFNDHRREIAHYYCELAERAEEQNELAKFLQIALETDRGCARAYQLQGRLLLEKGELIGAVHALQSVGDCALTLLPDILPELSRAYEQLERSKEFLQWLEETEARGNNLRLTLALAETLQTHNPAAAEKLLTTRLAENHSPLLLAAYLSHNHEQQALSELIGQAITPRTVYQCGECGFRQQRLIWHCPACFAWSSFQPVLELKVEQR